MSRKGEWLWHKPESPPKPPKVKSEPVARGVKLEPMTPPPEDPIKTEPVTPTAASFQPTKASTPVDQVKLKNKNL